MRRHWLAVLVAFVSIVGATQRALSDGAPYEYTPPPPPVRIGWTGFYLGVNLGGAWGSSTATDTGGVVLDDSFSASPSGVVVSANLGYNWQLGPMIYGLEGDIGDLGLASSGGYYVPFGYDASTTTDTEFYLTLRARLGFLLNGWLLYATGGYIGADTNVQVLEACSSFCTTPTVSASNSGWRNGWTLGGGVELALDGAWTAKVEYLYYNFGSVDVTTPPTSALGGNTWNVETDGSLVRVGLNYRFNGFKGFGFGQ